MYIRTKNGNIANEILSKDPVHLTNRALVTPGSGAHRSAIRLRTLNFDPITTLVSQYKALEKEIERQEKIRDGVVVELNANGKPKAYRAEVHHALYDKLTNISDKLLRYAYSRVPEDVVEEKVTSPLIVNLTKKGETYVVNDVPETVEDDYERESDNQ
jgi:hypothetical protein